jgi:rhodanese-related sulfurtransferase
MSAPSIDPAQAAERLRLGAILLDVREPIELQMASVEGALHMPMRTVPQRAAELPKDEPILVLCHHGSRSQAVADWLVARGYQALNVEGGIDAWADAVDSRIPKY